MSSQIAAASIESYQTVLFGVTQRVTIREGKTVVVLGAGGGIGLTAVDMARGQGAEVLAVASSEEKRALGTGGRFYVIGFASGEIPRLPANIVLLRNRMIVGIDWATGRVKKLGRLGTPACWTSSTAGSPQES